MLSSLFKHELLVKVLKQDLLWIVREINPVIQQPSSVLYPFFAESNRIKKFNFLFKLFESAWCEVDHKFSVSDFAI